MPHSVAIWRPIRPRAVREAPESHRARTRDPPIPTGRYHRVYSSEGGAFVLPPVSPGLFQPALAVRRCSRRPLDWVRGRQGPYLVVPLVVSIALGAFAFAAWPAAPPATRIRLGARLVVFILGTWQPWRRCGCIVLPSGGAFPLLGRAISAGLAICALAPRGIAASG